MRWRIALWMALGLVVTSCASTPDPPPPPPPKPKVQPPPPPPPPPPPMRVAVARVRAVETARVPRDVIETLSNKINDGMIRPGIVLLVPTSTTEQDTTCALEACQITSARAMGADTVLHTRIVQYAEHCMLLAMQYDAQSARSLWGFTKSAMCEAEPLGVAITAMLSAFDARPDVSLSAVHAVLPVQHDIEDIKFASESYAEVLSTLLAQAGRTVVAASGVGLMPDGQRVEAKKACADKKCAYERGAAALGDKAITTKITKKRSACTVSSTLHDIVTKTSTINATAKTTCDPHELAESLMGLTQQLVGH